MFCALAALGYAAPRSAGAQLPSSLGAAGGEASPPASIAGLDARPVAPLEFSRGWLGKAAEVRRRRAELAASGELAGLAPAAAAARGAALAGVLRVPVIPVRYADVAAPFAETVLAERLFGAGRADTVSFSGYWREVSSGLVTVEGDVAPWIRLPRNAAHYLPQQQFGWAQFGRMAEFRAEVLRRADELLDFGRYDNDGPDGVPNSGDDDGFVDFVAFLYATSCPGDWRTGAIWPHRGAMAPFETNDLAANGEPVRVADYVILPALEPGTCAPLHVGVLAHEAGHALGLPDLYDYDGSSQGIGAWGLMGTGSHSARWSPAHPSAWEKEQVGWVRVEWIGPGDTLLAAPPVEREAVVFRYDLPASGGQYLLLENRQRVGSDRRLPGTGLLIWRVEPDRGELGAWNRDENRTAVGLLQADARGDLGRGSNADGGDPFPGATRRHVFELPSPHPFRLAGITETSDGTVTAKLGIGFHTPALVAAPASVWLTAAPGGSAGKAVTVRREGGAAAAWQPARWPEWSRVERLGDVLIVRARAAGLAPGTYHGVVELELVGGDQKAGHVPVHFHVASARQPEVVARELPWSWGLAVRDGHVLQAGYGWDPLALRPRPRLLHLWDGQRYPETLARLPADALYAPVPGPSGSAFVLARARGQNYLYRVEADGRAAVVTAELGGEPTYGAAPLPGGGVVIADWSGRLRRVSAQGQVQHWIDLGARLYQIASDSAGVVYAATHAGNIIRVDPRGWRSVLPTGFERGRLVAVAATSDGDVLAGERGGEGRILRIGKDGSRQILARVPGAEFYGLAVDEGFLYALDLHHRNLMRIPLQAGSPIAVAAEE
ncbi:MAG: M6 family metalloprotease domain-containing protein [Gemmatimonadetes bacterium]|nr:M6 family metalloprotease domain-containing protein [Gemmatimonadota bacterium]